MKFNYGNLHRIQLCELLVRETIQKGTAELKIN